CSPTLLLRCHCLFFPPTFFCYCSASRRVPHSFPTRRSSDLEFLAALRAIRGAALPCELPLPEPTGGPVDPMRVNVELGEAGQSRSEEHTSELQSREKLVCRLLLEKKNN